MNNSLLQCLLTVIVVLVVKVSLQYQEIPLNVILTSVALPLIRKSCSLHVHPGDDLILKAIKLWRILEAKPILKARGRE